MYNHTLTYLQSLNSSLVLLRMQLSSPKVTRYSKWDFPVPFQKYPQCVADLLSFGQRQDRWHKTKEKSVTAAPENRVRMSTAKVLFPWQSSEWNWQQRHFLWKMYTWGRNVQLSREYLWKLCKSFLNSCQLYYVRKSHSWDFKNISRQGIKKLFKCMPALSVKC